MGSPATRQELKTELEAARLEFHALVRSLSERDLRRPSLNPGWSNREILFHMTLGFLLIPILLRLVRLFNRVPPGYSTGFAKALNASTPAFNVVNATGPRLAARVVYGARLEGWFNRGHRAIVRQLHDSSDEELALGMPFPSRWDPLFQDVMTVEELFRFPVVHFRFHVRQLAR